VSNTSRLSPALWRLSHSALSIIPRDAHLIMSLLVSQMGQTA
jgi:hypothetical protein